MNLLTMFQRAYAKLNLTPSERAALKLLQGVGMAGIVAAVGVLSTLLSTGQFALNERTLGGIGVAAFVAILNAGAKLASAKGDAPLAGALSAISSDAASHSPLHQQAAPPAPETAI